MTTAQELLSLELNILQRTQYLIALADNAAASHRLKACLQSHLAELDQLESRIQRAAAQRGWEMPELQPAAKWFVGFAFRCRDDREIAEYLTKHSTDNSIRLLKTYNLWNQDDRQVKDLFQNHLDCSAACIRQMQPFL